MLKQEADSKLYKPVQLPNLLLKVPSGELKNIQNNKFNNGLIDSEEYSKSKLTDKSAGLLFSSTELN